MTIHEFISSLIERLRSSKYLSNIGWLVRGNFISQFFQVISIPLISRLYSPDDFGLFALFTSFVGFSVVILSLKLESTLLISDKEEVPLLRASAFWLVLFLSLTLSLLLFLFQHIGVLSYELLPTWSPLLLVITLVGHGFFNVERAVALREGDAKLIAKARVEKSVSNILIKILLGLVTFGPLGLFLGEATGAWYAFKRVSKGVFNSLNSIFSTSNVSFRKTWIKYKKFPLIESPSALLDQIALVLPVPMIAVIGGVNAAGAFGMARLIVALPNIQIGRAIGDGFQWKISESLRNGDQANLMRTLKKTFFVLACIGVIPYTLLGMLSPWAFPIILGDEWASAGSFAALLSVWMYFSFVVTPLSRVLSVLRQQEYKVFYDVFVLVSLLTLFIFAQSYHMKTLEFIAILVAINSIGYLIYGSIIFLRCKKITGVVST